jgi:hypothetical protein
MDGGMMMNPFPGYLYKSTLGKFKQERGQRRAEVTPEGPTQAAAASRSPWRFGGRERVDGGVVSGLLLVRAACPAATQCGLFAFSAHPFLACLRGCRELRNGADEHDAVEFKRRLLNARSIKGRSLLHIAAARRGRCKP